MKRSSFPIPDHYTRLDTVDRVDGKLLRSPFHSENSVYLIDQKDELPTVPNNLAHHVKIYT